MHHGFKIQISFEISQGKKAAAELMGRPPLRNTGNVTKVESAISNDRRHTVCDLAEIAGLGKPTVHRILKPDLKMSKASAR